MKILVTGANGQVGRELVIAAQQQAISCVAYDRSQLDISNANTVSSVINRQNIDLVINAAAYTAVDAAETNSDAAFSVNRDGVKNLALACDQRDIPLLHISTDFIFGGNQSGAYSEEDIAAPMNVYGKSKLAGEKILASTLEKHIILRTSWVYSEHGANFVKTMLRLMRERDQLQVVNDQWGCPTSARSIAQALLVIARLVLEKKVPDWGIYHFSAKGRTNWCAFAQEILLQARQYEPLEVVIEGISSENWVSAATRPKNSEFSTEKIATTFGIEIEFWQKQLSPVIEYLCQR
ncbi:MAG: dTDP-4-dehydrorhamnose reductase [Gammaproteobacteria bacterium]|nr:dTDP-4-dehydrorhamnose reductase [Gammaproteobacteria bacterium]